MKALELVWLAKGMSRDKAVLKSEEIETVAIIAMSSHTCLFIN